MALIEQISALFQEYPFLSIPLFILALYFLFQFVKKLVIRLLALAVILLALLIGYTVFVQPGSNLPEVGVMKKKADNTVDGARRTVDQIKQIKKRTDAINEQRKRLKELIE